MKLLVALAALAALGCAPARETAAPAAAEPGADAGGILLVGNKGENSLSFIDLASGRELGRAATGPMPHEIAISPDGRQAAVVAYGGQTIDIFDVAGRARLRTIDLSPNQGPHGIAWLADGRILVTTERSRSLTVVDTARGDAVSAIATGEEGTHMVAVSPDRRLAFTANIQAGTVSVIDLAAGRLIRNFTVSGEPEAIALTPDGRTLWVGDLAGSRVQAFDAGALAAADESGFRPTVQIDVTVAAGSTDEVEDAVLEPLLRALSTPEITGTEFAAETGARTGRGRFSAYFARGTGLAEVRRLVEQGISRAASAFPAGRTEIELRFAGDRPLAVLDTGAVPIRAAASPDGRWIVTSNLGDGSLTLIDARRREAVRTITVSGAREAGQVTILFSADGRLLYAAETGRDRVAEIELESGIVRRRLAAGAQGDGLAIAAAAAR